MKFTTEILRELKHAHPGGHVPDVFVETGTWTGVTTELAVDHFKEVHTIERSVSHFLRAVNLFRYYPTIHCHFGDSAAIMIYLCELLPSAPVMFYLDAHWFKHSSGRPAPGVVGFGEFPLWGELEAIARRGQPDIIVVDDVHRFGTTDAEPGWQDVSLDSICRCLRENARQSTPWGPCGTDQVAAFLQ